VGVSGRGERGEGWGGGMEVGGEEEEENRDAVCMGREKVMGVRGQGGGTKVGVGGGRRRE